MTSNDKSILATTARPMMAAALTAAALLVTMSGCGGCQSVPDWWTPEGSIDSEPLADRPQRDDGALFEKLYETRTPVQFRAYMRYYISDHRILWAQFRTG